MALDSRPNPDDLLAHLQAEELRPQHEQQSAGGDDPLCKASKR